MVVRFQLPLSEVSSETSISSGGINTTLPSFHVAIEFPARLCIRSAWLTARLKTVSMALASTTNSCFGSLRSSLILRPYISLARRLTLECPCQRLDLPPRLAMDYRRQNYRTSPTYLPVAGKARKNCVSLSDNVGG